MIVVLADDLSGAAELAGAALRHGLSAEVQTEFSAATDAEVVCVDTDTRLLPPAEAAPIAEAFACEAAAAQPAWIFKKCDSVLRGPVLAEARAMARAAAKQRIVILSANPARRRVIRAGRYFVEGVPLDQTVFAHDPAHPRTTASVAGLLGGDLAGIETPDAETAADVARAAASVDRATLPVGAVDFFEALLAAHGPTRAIPPDAPHLPHFPALLVCGSAASWGQRRAEAEKLGIPVFALPHDLSAVGGALRSQGRALLGIGDGPATQGVPPAGLTETLAASVATLLGAVPVARLLLEGGATARAVIRAQGWSRLRACEASAPGVGALCPTAAPGHLLLIKPGSYPWPAAVWP
ncbi:MAG: four-carbon acid sugar kinase family protein [Verrucomicrobiota bacterium]